MRSSLIVRGVSATAAVLLLTACGGGSDDTESAFETTASSSSAPAETTSEAPAASSEFCTEAEVFGNRVSTSLSGAEDPAEAERQIRQAAEELRAIEPPDEIADDWSALADGLESLAGTVAGATSNNDPEAAAKLQAQLQELQTSATNVTTYLQQECGIDAEGTGTSTESAAPSS